MAKKSFDQRMTIENNKVKVVTTSIASKGVAGKQATWRFTRHFKDIPNAQRFVDRVRVATLTGVGRPVNSTALAGIGQRGVKADGSTHGKNYYNGPDRAQYLRFSAR